METINAVIFDMDGCLVDTEPVINRAAILALQEWGVRATPEDFTPFIGAGEAAYIGGVAEKYGLRYEPVMKDRVYEIYLEIVDNMLKPFPGAVDCLQQLKEAGFKLALASSADHLKIDANLRVAGIHRALFDAVLGAEDVTHKKPAPDIYLAAAQRLNEKHEQCLVVEDALNGIEAAKRAGMLCVAVETTFSRQLLLKAGADFIVAKIAEICDLVAEKKKSQ